MHFWPYHDNDAMNNPSVLSYPIDNILAWCEQQVDMGLGSFSRDVYIQRVPMNELFIKLN